MSALDSDDLMPEDAVAPFWNSGNVTEVTVWPDWQGWMRT